VVKNIRDQGFDVMLMLEATIGLNQVESESEDDATDAGKGDPLSAFTHNDLNFLKSLRITLPDEEVIDPDADPPGDSSANPPAEL
jgi:hypothetical protein